MASHTVAAGKIGAYGFSLTASTVDTITFADDVHSVEIGSDGTAAIYFTTDGSAPTVAGAGTYVLPAAGGTLYRSQGASPSNGLVVKLISSGTPAYWVARADV